MPETDRLTRRLRRNLDALDRDGLRRILLPPAGFDFSSNDYLALSQHPLLKKRMAEAALADGVGSTGSRLLRGERDAFSRIEQRFAELKGTERALYFSSGYLANLAVLSTFAEPGDFVFSDALNHASLIDGARLSRAQRVIYPHGDLAALERLLHEHRGEGQAYIVTESLFSMDGDFAAIPDLVRLCRATSAALIVDEAHAIGVWGRDGRGLIEGADAFLTINTAGKALGVNGAFVAGSAIAIETLIQRARQFVFSTAAPPPIAAVIDASLDVLRNEPKRRETVIRLANHLRHRLGMQKGSQIIPLVLGDNDRAVRVAADLQGAGFDVRAIRPPSVPQGTARLRISVNAGLTEEILDSFADALAAALEASQCVASS